MEIGKKMEFRTIDEVKVAYERVVEEIENLRTHPDFTDPCFAAGPLLLDETDINAWIYIYRYEEAKLYEIKRRIFSPTRVNINGISFEF